ncbi:hypothetical protein JOF56_003335 [Kibdelosporangium banguiense]|uniref:DUF4034 domain-containing protein n=1 Tax=Kibdelosporangium banguiense TaxID=1365924 RepID=A0ABS4TEW1_9PSEU|nr:hypothetical protein [Kibdelosporangium banguiense]MBP2322950.1 hypothetical protein [Kibdelosporangium banguiense]
MKRSGWIVVFALLASLVMPLPASAAGRTPGDCTAALDCTAAEINLMSMDDRLEFVRLMQSGPGAQLDATDRWRNIEGVITFFRDHNMGAPGTWVSYVDSGIVEGVERGIAIALGRSQDEFGNPGSRKWATYLTKLHAGQLTVRNVHDKAWGEAEQASTDHGVVLAERVHKIKPTAVERRFFLFSEFYRWTLRNRPAALDLLAVYGGLIHPDLARQRVPFLDWFTDVGNPVPSRKGCELAYAFARLDPIAGLFTTVDLLLAYIPDLFREYRAAA